MNFEFYTVIVSGREGGEILTFCFMFELIKTPGVPHPQFKEVIMYYGFNYDQGKKEDHQNYSLNYIVIIFIYNL